MATDIPREHQAVVSAPPSGRLPLGVGLLIAGGASVGLWAAVFAALRGLF